MADTPTPAYQEAFAEGSPISALPAGDVDVVTVDDDGRVLGTASRHAAHQGSGLRHLAVSIVVVDAEGRLLLQRRAEAKPLFSGLWSNTVCTHPLPAEDPARAAIRRLEEEMGLHCALAPSGTFSYQADDPVSGLAENEFDYVFTGTTDNQPQPNPAEISAIRWVTVDDLAAERRNFPELFTPWLGLVLQAAGLDPNPTDRETSSRSAPTGATP